MLSLLFNLNSVDDVRKGTYFDVIPKDIRYLLDAQLYKQREYEKFKEIEEEYSSGLVLYEGKNLLSPTFVALHNAMRDPRFTNKKKHKKKEGLLVAVNALGVLIRETKIMEKKEYITTYVFNVLLCGMQREFYAFYPCLLRRIETIIEGLERQDIETDILKHYLPMWKCFFAQCWVYANNL